MCLHIRVPPFHVSVGKHYNEKKQYIFSSCETRERHLPPAVLFVAFVATVQSLRRRDAKNLDAIVSLPMLNSRSRGSALDSGVDGNDFKKDSVVKCIDANWSDLLLRQRATTPF